MPFCVCDARELAEDSECSVPQPLDNPVVSPVVALDSKRHRGKGGERARIESVIDHQE